MVVLELLALVAFLASAIWSAIQRAWPVCLLAVGAFLLALASAGLVEG